MGISRGQGKYNYEIYIDNILININIILDFFFYFEFILRIENI